MPHWFFAPCLTEGPCRLSPGESRHARGSCRLSAGDEVVLFDGQGGLGAGRIAVGGPGDLVVEVREVIRTAPRRPRLALVFAVPKGPRSDTLIEKCCELGVARLQPLRAARSVSQAGSHRLDRWRRQVVEAAKQSHQPWCAEVAEACSLAEALGSLRRFDMNLVASLDQGAVRLIDLAGRLAECQTVQAFIGPEGGWTDQEAAALRDAGVTPVSLGPGVLRIETAAVALAAFVHLLMTDPAPMSS